MDLTVTYNKKGNRQLMELESQCMDDIEIDYTNIPEGERGGAAKQLLAASVLNCFASAFAKALEVRGAHYEKITGKATLHVGLNERKQARVLGIDIDVAAHMPEEFADIFDRVTKVMRHGCLISASLEPAMAISYDMRHICAGECSLEFNSEEHAVHYAPAGQAQ